MSVFLFPSGCLDVSLSSRVSLPFLALYTSCVVQGVHTLCMLNGCALVPPRSATDMFFVSLTLLSTYISPKFPISHDCLSIVRGQCKLGCYLDNYEFQHGSIRCRLLGILSTLAGRKPGHFRSAELLVGLEEATSKCKRNPGTSSSHLATRSEDTKGTCVCHKSSREAAEGNVMYTASECRRQSFHLYSG